LIRVSPQLLQKVCETYGAYFSPLSGLPAEKLSADVLSEEKVHDQVRLFCKTIGRSESSLQGCRLLEVGSGFGIFVAVTRTQYGADAVGLEPAGTGFDTSFEVCREVLKEYGLDPELIVDAKGENIPFPDNSFDLVFSSTVLEHTDDPWRVLDEAIRVLRPGGYLQFVFPNYGSFFEGHYAVPWIPYLNKSVARMYLRLWRRDPSFIDTIQFLNFFKVRRWASKRRDIRIITYGADIFRESMLNLQIKNWAGLGKIKRWMEFANRLKLLRPVTAVLLAGGAFEPIILTLQKLPKAGENSAFASTLAT
jgi:SAM-dependent methyltransferase